MAKFLMKGFITEFEPFNEIPAQDFSWYQMSILQQPAVINELLQIG